MELLYILHFFDTHMATSEDKSVIIQGIGDLAELAETAEMEETMDFQLQSSDNLRTVASNSIASLSYIQYNQQL